MDQPTEKEIFEECARQIKDIASEQQQKLNQQIEDFKTLINQHFINYIASIDNSEPNSAEVSIESYPQSEHQQQTSTLSSSNTDNIGQENVLFDLSCKRGPKKKETLPIDLTTNVLDSGQPLNLSNNSGFEQVQTAQQVVNDKVVQVAQPEPSPQLPKQLLPQTASSSKVPLVFVADRVHVKQEHFGNIWSLMTKDLALPPQPPQLPQISQPNSQTQRPIKTKETSLAKVSLVEYDDTSNSDSEMLLDNSTTAKNITAPTSVPSTSTAVYTKTTLPSASKQPNISVALFKPNISERSYKLIKDDSESDESNESSKKIIFKKSSKKSVQGTRKRSVSPTRNLSSKSPQKKEKRSKILSRSRSKSSSKSYEQNQSKKSQKESRSRSQNISPKRSSRKKSRSKFSVEESTTSSRIFKNNFSDEASTSDQQPKFAQFLIKSLQCTQPKCNKKFDNLTQLNDHLEDRHSITEPYKCLFYEKCKGRFRNREQLLQHQITDHESGCRWSCDQCNAFYYDPENLLVHIDLAHTVGDFLCSVKGCKNFAHTKKWAYAHFYSFHIQSKYSFKLRDGVVIRSEAKRESVPGNQFKVIPTFKNSNAKYMTVWEECTVAGCKEDSSKYDSQWLGSHLFKKHGLKHFRCFARNCESSFDRLFELNSHVRQAHLRANWNCSKEGCSFAEMLFNGFEINEHNVLFHGKGIFKCKFCHFSAKYRYQVIEHFDEEHAVC